MAWARPRQDEPGPAGQGPASLLPALALLFVSALVLASAALMPGPATRQVAVLFNPLAPQSAVAGALAAADVRLVRNGATDAIVVVELGETGSTGSLYAAGAWLVLDAVAAGGCGLLGIPETDRT